MNKKLVMMSFDALGDVDANLFESMPGFKYMIEEGSYIKRVKTVYPSLTYPCHASIISGRYPKDHGIVNNLLLQTGRKDMDWYWYEKYLKGDSLFRAARRKGLKTASLLWPVSARGNIDYNIAEIFPHRIWQNQVSVSLINSSPKLLIDLDRRFGYMRDGISQPQLDDFIEASMHYIIKKFGPDLVMSHFVAVDDKKHRYGTKSDEVEKAISTYDDRIVNMLELLDYCRDTNLIVVSDHSQIDLKVGIRLNKYLCELGYIEMSAGRIKKYKAIMQEAGGSCYIYSKDDDEEFLRELLMRLEEFAEKHKGIERIYNSDQAEMLGADPDCAFMIEAEKGYYFLQDTDGEIFDETFPKHRATHGYSPDKRGYSAVFFAIGPDFKNTKLEEARLIDIAPTISKVMNLGLKGAAGKCLYEIIEGHRI
ncbi:MAG: ectonucleotide pyrophosphatase/phosphodiesterase [Tissierellia bacterium]|nr:ectonucleotide pyrophosphatase/phosphodiesterase [Tissierellia bacterium]